MTTSNQNNKHLILAALGVVYGDIGTSPLYTLQECFETSRIHPGDASVLGILSLIMWSLILTVTFKYILLILRADHQGEGGTLALNTLVLQSWPTASRFFLVTGMIGASLLYGDGVITPAISVLSAVEGLSIISPKLTPLVVPISVIILIGLFCFQKKGTNAVGGLFGPAMLLWFLSIGTIGLRHIIDAPEVFKALNPYYGYIFFQQNGWMAFKTLGSVVLAITGAEALYADLGHFGRNPIRKAWVWCVFPCLLFNYFGQGAFLLKHPDQLEHVFFQMFPTILLTPAIILATVATVIASQALISGVFSLSWQAIQLHFLPRMKILHTSPKLQGQVYLPIINKILMFLTIGIVILFESSNALADAYGVAIMGIMWMTTLLGGIYAYLKWNWPIWKMVCIFLPLGFVDTVFLSACLHKAITGGWLPILISVGAIFIMMTWSRGIYLLHKRLKKEEPNIHNYVDKIKDTQRIPGCGVYLNITPFIVPKTLRLNRKYHKVLHEYIVLFSVIMRDKTYVPLNEKIDIVSFKDGVYQIILYYGFYETINLNTIMAKVEEILPHLPEEKVFFVTRHIVLPSLKEKQSWRVYLQERLFIFLTRLTISAIEFFKLPIEQSIEVSIVQRLPRLFGFSPGETDVKSNFKEQPPID